jgi:RNA polymerase sigma factor (TIGR02999 family)
MTEASQLLMSIEQGDPLAASKLLPLVYDELRQLAAQRMAREVSNQTLDPTGLVHEAYLRLVGNNPHEPWNGRGHFFAAAAEAMRRILIENARRKRRLRHGGEKQRIELHEACLGQETEEDNMVAVGEAIDKLSKVDEVAAQVVKFRYFMGLTVEETADVLGISARTTKRHWSYARAWLFRELNSST